MSSATNIPINSRTLSGVILISDGVATLENGDLNCDDVISNTVSTGNMTTNNLTCKGELRTNTNGPYLIPTATTSITGSLISYGNVLNTGATDITNYGSTYNLLKQGFYFNNINSTQTLTNLAIIDNSQTYFKSQLTGCTAETPLNPTSVVNKSYVDNNFVDRTNNLTQSINGVKTFTNTTNFTGSLRTKTNFKLNEIDDYTGNTINLTFPMAQLTILRISSGTSMTLNLPQLTANERGMIFYFLKTNNTTNCTVNAYTGQGIVVATDISTPVASSTNILSADKVMMKLYVGYYQTLTFWVELTEFSTFDRLKLREWVNLPQTHILGLTFAMMSPTMALRVNTSNPLTITLPTLNDNERGKIFTFVKVQPIKYNVIFNTSGGNSIFALNDLNGNPTTNSTIFPSNKVVCRLAVGWAGTTNYWIEVGDYSTYDRDENNLLYPRLAIENTFTNNNIFNGQATFNNFTPISSVATPSANNHLVRKDYVDNNFVNLSTAQNIYGSKYFGSRVQLYGGIALDVGPGTSTFAGVVTFSNNITCSASLISNNITSPVVLGGTNNIFTNLDTATGGAIINIGAKNNNINVKCNLNINESAYLTGSQNTLIWMEGNSSRFENQNSTNGDYIFTIVESGITYNPFVINKTSVDIAGDAVVGGNLILYDTTPSTLSMSVGVLGNDMTFDPENTTNTTYKFKVNDSTGTSTTTPLTISTASTTLSNALISNSTATFNNGATFNSVIPTTSITASSPNDLVNYTTLTSQGYTTLSAVQSNTNTFTSTNTFNGNLVSATGLIVKDSSLQFKNGTKEINSFLSSTGELTFQTFFSSNTYKFQCFNSSGTADKSAFITFDKTTLQMPLEVVDSATFNSTATFSGDVTLSKTKNNSSYATYNGLTSTYIGYLTEVPPGVYVGIASGTQYQLGAITLDNTNVGFWTCNYEVEINCSTAGSISKIYVFVSNNLVSTTAPIGLPGAKANNFSTQTYAVGDSTYHSGSFSFLQSTTTVVYGVQLIAIVASGGFQRKGQIRMLRIL